MQRVRIGLTGLAFVFVAVLLAAALVREPSAETPITANGAAPQTSNTASQAPPRDPLADLGVAPRGDQNEVSTNAATPEAR